MALKFPGDPVRDQIEPQRKGRINHRDRDDAPVAQRVIVPARRSSFYLETKGVTTTFRTEFVPVASVNKAKP